MNILRGESGVNTLIGLKVGAEEVKVLMREYQVDPLSRRLLHADFYRIAMDKTLVVKVPVTVKGEAKASSSRAALLDIVHREVEIECCRRHPRAHRGGRHRADARPGRPPARRRHRPAWKPVTDAEVMLVHIIAPRTARSRRRRKRRPPVPAAAEPRGHQEGQG